MKNLELLQHQSHEIHLQEEERQAMRESLIAYINKNPVPTLTEKKPASRSWIDNCRPANWNRGIKLIALLLVFALMGTAVVSAANRTAPGDFLYPIKIKINEQVQRQFSFGDKHRAQTEINLAEHRLIEAERLQHESRLSDSVRTTLEENFQDHINRASANIKSLASHNNVQDALTTNFNLVSTVGSHALIVNVLMAGNKTALAATTTASTTSK